MELLKNIEIELQLPKGTLIPKLVNKYLWYIVNIKKLQLGI